MPLSTFSSAGSWVSAGARRHAQARAHILSRGGKLPLGVFCLCALQQSDIATSCLCTYSQRASLRTHRLQRAQHCCKLHGQRVGRQQQLLQLQHCQRGLLLGEQRGVHASLRG